MKKNIIIGISFILLFSCGGDEGSAGLEVKLPVSIMEIKPSYIAEYLDNTATVQAVKEAELSVEVKGFYFLQTNPLTKKPYTPGDYVKKGTLIIRLENPEHVSSVRLESEKLNLDISKREYEKQKSLYDKGGVTLRELINSERTYVDAQYSYDNALLQMRKLEIRAPFDGVIVDLPFYSRGSEVQTGSNLLKVMDYSQLYAEVSYPAAEIGRIKKSQPVKAMHYTLPKDTLDGVVDYASPAIDADTRTFKAGITIQNPDLILRPGMFVKLQTVIEELDSVIVIPKEIILTKRGGKTVFIVNKEEALSRVITTGLENEKQAQVVEGLKFDERLVIKGFETLQNHSKVKIIR
ncbi:MAG: efflux RND transporter periplasmic adaptor subunit [Calditrichaceae bacterium]|nr:efflux RND transporter periplasmic adaptor subunit [Calditrichaceae bacterium]MBN2709799.1 efflux RND transporter periplasmic adaptor subunit [Calditrichaceae bacterium]RQV94994.1 MAG: efflux RND transporter periplasmic adaptor subunit [Calditrichota bacterium]